MQADEAFFKLLRLGIGTCHDRDVALDKAGWAAVYDMACKQAVAAIVLHDFADSFPAILLSTARLPRRPLASSQ